MPGKGFNVVVQIDLREPLKIEAVKKGLTMADLIDSIIREWLEEEGLL